MNESDIRQAWHEEIDRLARLPANWNDCGSAAMDPQIIAAAHHLADELSTKGAADARIMPLALGRLQWEWRRGKKSLEIELESPTQLRFFQCDPPNRFENEENLAAHDRTSLERLVEWFAEDSLEVRG